MFTDLFWGTLSGAPPLTMPSTPHWVILGDSTTEPGPHPLLGFLRVGSTHDPNPTTGKKYQEEFKMKTCRFKAGFLLISHTSSFYFVFVFFFFFGNRITLYRLSLSETQETHLLLLCL
jgi:hypothetical protein